MKKRLLMPLLFVVLACQSAWAGQLRMPTPSESSKCPVCGMFVSQYPDWTCAMAFRSSPVVFFDGPKDMFVYYLNPGKYNPGKNRQAIAAVYVKDYYSLAVIDGRKAYFVAGSDVYGPMGKEIVPFASRGDAAEFMRDHKGKRIVRFNEVTPALLGTLE